jgi:hypothetical protein
MANTNLSIIGADEFKRALARNPRKIVEEIGKLIIRGLAQYKSGINNSPWRIGMSGGGVPVLSGNLRDTHSTRISSLEGAIFPTANYAKYVHDGTSKRKSRPWLDYVKQDKDSAIRKLESELLDNVIKDLAN